jgi:hypothetical protein
VVVTTRRSRIGLTVAALLVVAVTGLERAPSAQARPPCWVHVVDDWSAGALGSTYPVACYLAAIAHLPEDVRVYSSAEDDIRLAMLGAIEVRATPPPAAAAPRRLEAQTAKPRPPVIEQHAPLPTRRPDPVPRATRRLAAGPVAKGHARYGPALLPVAVAGALVLSLVAATAYAVLRGALSTRRRR